MTVKALIKELQKMPQDATIKYYDGDNGWTTVMACSYQERIIDSIYNPNPNYIEGKFVILTEC